ncbi:MAG: 2-hydroxyacid dehydrogenase [Clostridia bacterium]|nr:2-hydroxyacid dehydrogenase [Clostridia bacterium]
MKKTIAFFDAKPYDKIWFDQLVNDRYDIRYLESKCNSDTAALAKGCEAVCAFVNDDLSAATIERLYENGVRVLAMRSAGYSNVDFKAAYGKINVVRVPAYSPYAVAEHAMALLLTLNRKVHKAYNRTRDFNFSLSGLIGTDLHGKTAGVIGTGKIGQVFINICKGFGMRVLAYDPYPIPDASFEYVDLPTLLRESDVISLHCPLTEQTHHILDVNAFRQMKKEAFIINTSRGALIDSAALLAALNLKRIGGAGLDVYEEEADIFFEDYSGEIIQDDVLSLLTSRPNVIITSHQAFLTDEALRNIADVTLKNLDAYFAGEDLENEICYHCDSGKVAGGCRKTRKERCFQAPPIDLRSTDTDSFRN